MEIQKLPIFNELIEIICNYRIESWQISDFWNEIKLLKVAANDANYQSLYRLIQRLVKDGYLIVSHSNTYTQNSNLQDLRLQFCYNSPSPFKSLLLEKTKINSEMRNLEEEILALEEFKSSFIRIQLQIEQLKQIKIDEIYILKIKLRVLDSLINYFQ